MSEEKESRYTKKYFSTLALIFVSVFLVSYSIMQVIQDPEAYFDKEISDTIVIDGFDNIIFLHGMTLKNTIIFTNTDEVRIALLVRNATGLTITDNSFYGEKDVGKFFVTNPFDVPISCWYKGMHCLFVAEFINQDEFKKIKTENRYGVV